jgi:23S rRNA (adenine2503-C2)-methyltransferase
MGCVFCATGQMGFMRNLTAGEIIEQVLFFARDLKGQFEKLTNIVFMGMGEPFHNYEQTMKAIDILNHPGGFNFGSRRFTVSTVGVIPGIKRFTEEKRQVNLAVSLHAATNELRSSLLPINKKYPLEDLLGACLDYVKVTKRRISFEWALIKNINDSNEQFSQLCRILQPFVQKDSALCHVNVIPLNPTRRYAGEPTPAARAREICERIQSQGIPATVRLRRGIDIEAGCGQLVCIN